jgi:hypothetical protein
MKLARIAGTKGSWWLALIAITALTLTAWAWQNPRLMLELMSQAWSCF